MPPSVSPPPIKRRKTAQTDESSTSASALTPSLPPSPPSPDTLRIYSWNINGIEPFLQSSIEKYFTASTNNKSKGFRGSKRSSANLRNFLVQHHYPAILLLQEVKISPTDASTQMQVRRAVNTPLPSEEANAKPLLEQGLADIGLPNYNVHYTLPTDPHNARGPNGSRKVYGVTSIIRSDLARTYGAEINVRTVDWDHEGRISIVEIVQDQECPAPGALPPTHRRIAIFNIYAVNGTDNPYKNPATGAICGTRHDRKLEFHRLLMEECMKYEEKDWDVVLGGDMNVAPERIDGWPKLRTWPMQHVKNREDFNAKFLSGEKRKTCGEEAMKGGNEEDDGGEKESGKSGSGDDNGAGGKATNMVWHGVDVWRAMHPDEKRFTYYSRGREWGTSCDRVDYFIASKKLYERKKGVVEAGMLDSGEGRGPSDHVPIWIDINLRRP